MPSDALVDKNCYRGVCAGIWNVLNHPSHNERISDDEAEVFRRVAFRAFTDNCAVIKLYEQHQARLAKNFLNRVFKLGESLRRMSGLPEFRYVWFAHRCFDSCNNLLNRL